MNPTNLADVKSLLNRYDQKPNKRLGQHFLVDTTVRDRIIAAADIVQDDILLEVGPGLGALTIPLAHRAHRVIAVEKDGSLIPLLQEVLENNAITNVTILKKDILALLENSEAMRQWNHTAMPLVGALPFYLTSRFFRILLEQSSTVWKRGVFVIQRDVAERVVSEPPTMNLLGLSVQLFADPSIVETIPTSAFWPQPAVQSAAITLEPHSRYDSTIRQRVLTLARRAFRQKRKQLGNTLPSSLLQNAGIETVRRPQELSVTEWIQLGRAERE